MVEIVLEFVVDAMFFSALMASITLAFVGAGLMLYSFTTLSIPIITGSSLWFVLRLIIALSIISGFLITALLKL